jgi:hypothetical protein
MKPHVFTARVHGTRSGAIGWDWSSHRIHENSNSESNPATPLAGCVSEIEIPWCARVYICFPLIPTCRQPFKLFDCLPSKRISSPCWTVDSVVIESRLQYRRKMVSMMRVHISDSRTSAHCPNQSTKATPRHHEASCLLCRVSEILYAWQIFIVHPWEEGKSDEPELASARKSCG